MGPTWEKMVGRDPLIAFSWYLSGRVWYVRKLGKEIIGELDAAYATNVLDDDHFSRADMLMWFWTLGAYEVVRTMCQATDCFRSELTQRLSALKKELVQVRIPAAKMEVPGKSRPVSSNRSPWKWDMPNRDLLIGDPTKEMISVRHLIQRFEDVISSITPGDVLGRHEESYEKKA